MSCNYIQMFSLTRTHKKLKTTDRQTRGMGSALSDMNNCEGEKDTRPTDKYLNIHFPRCRNKYTAPMRLLYRRHRMVHFSEHIKSRQL